MKCNCEMDLSNWVYKLCEHHQRRFNADFEEFRREFVESLEEDDMSKGEKKESKSKEKKEHKKGKKGK